MKILFIGGCSRSGSTLLGRVLGEPADAVCVGETRYLWSRGLLNNVQCGCGEPFRSCPFWSAVGEHAFGGWDRVDAARLSEIDRLTNLPGALPIGWLPWLRPRLRAMITEYATCLTALYEAISHVSGANMIVEMSRDPTFARLLMRMPDSDVRILHLVRDSRAVAYSWTRTRRLPSPIGDQQFMPRFKVSETAISWMIRNAVFHVFSVARRPYLKLTHEGFLADPRATLRRLSAFAEEPLLAGGCEITDTQVKLGGHHIFSGNPMRSTTGWLPLRLDTAWQTQMPPSQFAKVTTITWPLLRLYGYRVMPRGARAEA